MKKKKSGSIKKKKNEEEKIQKEFSKKGKIKMESISYGDCRAIIKYERHNNGTDMIKNIVQRKEPCDEELLREYGHLGIGELGWIQLYLNFSYSLIP